jgi:hypothetical protein
MLDSSTSACFAPDEPFYADPRPDSLSARTDDPMTIEDALYPLGGGSSSPIGPFGGDDSPVPAHRQNKRERGRPLLPVPRLGAMREGLDAVRAYSRTVVGKERLVEAVIKEVGPTLWSFCRGCYRTLT